VPAGVEELTDTVSVDVAVPPELSVTLVGLRDAESPEEETVEVSVIVPAKPWRLVRVIVDVDEEPSGVVSFVGLAETLKLVMKSVAPKYRARRARSMMLTVPSALRSALGL
jgi:hypothetical protein